MNIFQFAAYREALREVLLAKKAEHGRTFTFAKMATACGIRHTYLSTVLNGNGDLSADQVFEATHFLQLNDNESHFIALLHEYERSQSKRRRQKLKSDIARAREKGLATDTYINAETLTYQAPTSHADFYLNINASLIHIFLTVPRYRDNLEKVRKVLAWDKEVFDDALSSCEKAGLIALQGKKIILLKDAFHLPATSAFYSMHRTMLRQKALEFMQAHSKARQFSFGVLYSATEETRSRVQARFLEFIDWVQTTTQDSPPTDVYQLNFDLLRWSEDG